MRGMGEGEGRRRWWAKATSERMPVCGGQADARLVATGSPRPQPESSGVRIPVSAGTRTPPEEMCALTACKTRGPRRRLPSRISVPTPSGPGPLVERVRRTRLPSKAHARSSPRPLPTGPSPRPLPSVALPPHDRARPKLRLREPGPRTHARENPSPRAYPTPRRRAPRWSARRGVPRRRPRSRCRRRCTCRGRCSPAHPPQTGAGWGCPSCRAPAR